MVDNRLIMPSVLDCPSRRAGATEQKLLSFALQLAGHYLKYCKKGVDKLESGKKRSGAGVPNMWVYSGWRERLRRHPEAASHTYEEVTDKVQPG